MLYRFTKICSTVAILFFEMVQTVLTVTQLKKKINQEPTNGKAGGLSNTHKRIPKEWHSIDWYSIGEMHVIMGT